MDSLNEPPHQNLWCGGEAIVDVRDMLCAQALAVVRKSSAQIKGGHFVSVLYNTEDVRRDLLAWVQGRGYSVSEPKPNTIRLERNNL